MEKSNVILILIILGLIVALFLDLGSIIGRIGGTPGDSLDQEYDIEFLKFSNVRFDGKTNLFSAELKNTARKDIKIIKTTVHYIHEGVEYEEQVSIPIGPGSSKIIELKLEKEPHRVSVTTSRYAIIILWHEGSCEGRSC